MKIENVWKKIKPYLLTSIIALTILTVIFFIKNIYPFGRNSLIWGDMHDQITAFYYHFYDVFKGNQSLLVDFTSGGGVNFLGVLAYYILSPFTFLVLLVKRTDIYLVASVIIALKIVCSSITCLFAIKTFYKKLPNLLSVLLAIVYAFSGYSLIMYQITSWIDAMYLLPLIIVGLKKVLDLEKPTMYIITLALSLIFSFYVSMMVILFIFLASFIYLLVYKEEKEDRKKGILALGISTVFSILLSLFIVVPSYLQISISSRLGFSMNTLLNSKTGPITDKASMFLFGGVMYVGLFYLLKNWKKNKKFLTFYLPVSLIVLIPVLIEPIHKIWHFGSYAFFPYRFGFITMFILILGACHGFQNLETIKGTITKKNQVFSILLACVIVFFIFATMYINYQGFQKAIETLTISINHILLLILILSTIVSIIGCFLILLLNKKLNTFSILLMSIITLTHISVNAAIYLGMDKEQRPLMSQYEELGKMSNTYQENNYYRVKNEASNMIMNSGIVSKYHTLDHYTSLTDRNNLESLKKMGYSSMWVKTFSKGGNLLLDAILANKYIITRKDINSEYYTLKNQFDGLNFYELKKEPSYGYLLNKNDTIFDKKNSFEISNSFYHNITGVDNDIFKIINALDLHNIKKTKVNQNHYYEKIDPDAYAYFEKEISIEEKQTVYLEIFKSLINNDCYKIYEKFNIYINDKLYVPKAFSENDNGVLNLGTYENETVNIKIELRKDVELNAITIGIMNNKMYEEFIENEKVDTKVVYHRNQVEVMVEGKEEGKLLFLPINYNKGYHATNNGEKVEIIRAYDNFIGIKLNQGENNIKLSFVPTGLIPCSIVSIVTLIAMIIILSSNLYDKILNINILANITYYSYVFVYLAMVVCIYIGFTLVFIISYFIPFKV